MNPETSLVWHPLQSRFKDLRTACLVADDTPPHWYRTEVRSTGGFPDLWWGWGSSGLIELKHRGEPPAGEDTPCVIESIQPTQRLFWRMACDAGAACHVLTRVGREWFLHDGEWARQWLGKTPLTVMRAASMFTPSNPGDLMENHRTLDLPDARTILLLVGARP